MANILGTIGNDQLSGRDMDDVYGLQGDDVLTSEPFNSLGVGLFGGSGNDTYNLGYGTTTTIIEAGNSSDDRLIAAFSGSSSEFQYFQLDNRHLVAFDDFSNTTIVVVDWKDEENRIEHWEWLGVNYSFSELQSALFSDPNYSGDVSSFGALSTSDIGAMNAAIMLAETKMEMFEDQAMLDTMPSYDNAVYRFYNQQTGTHFYTASENERDSVATELEDIFVYEGPAFGAANESGSSDVYRFYNETTNTHFYTISETERDYIIDHYTAFSYEGTAYQAYEQAGAGHDALYRFYNNDTGSHFYTASENERDYVIDNYSQFQFEGVAYYIDEIT